MSANEAPSEFLEGTTGHYYDQVGGDAEIDYTGSNPYAKGPGQGYSQRGGLWELGQRGGGGSLNYNSTLGAGDPGGRNKNMQYGFGGQMTTYDSTPAYQAQVQLMDEQTSDEMEKLREEFGADGMRNSGALMTEMSGTLRKAAGDKNRLLQDMKYKDFENAWGRQTKESDTLYNRGQSEEDSAWNRAKYGDEAGWDRAKGKAEFDREGGNQQFQNAMLLDNKEYSQARDLEQEEYNRYRAGDESAYRRWQEAQSTRRGIEQEEFSRWTQDNERGYSREQQAIRDMMGYGTLEDNWNQGIGNDLGEMGEYETGLGQDDADRQYKEWLRQQEGNIPDILKMLGGIGGGVMDIPEDFDWEKLAELLGSFAGGYSS